MKKIRIGITGGAGYTGGELIRILLNHPNAEMVFVQSKSNAGQLLSAVHQDLAGDTEIQFSENISSDIDLLYLCVGHGEARKFLQDNPPDRKSGSLTYLRISGLSQTIVFPHQENPLFMVYQN